MNPGYFGNERPEMMAYVPMEANVILEAGCGEGRFGEALTRRQGAEVWGVEPDPTAAEAASARLHRCIPSSLESAAATLPPSYFDCVVCNDVLEHLAAPWDTLAALRPALKPGGVIVASLPNVRHISVLMDLVVRGRWEYGQEGILDRTHLRFFTRSSIRTLFEGAGFHVRRLDGLNSTATWKMHLLSALSLGCLSDARYIQFACVAEKMD